jgi:hypothetical protein
MDLDEMKDIWDKEQDKTFRVPTDISHLKSAKGPLDKIRRNMKMELFAQVAAMILFALFPFHFEFRDELIAPFFALYAVMIAIIAYFLIRYYFVYRQLSNMSLTSKDHLYELYYEIRVHMEIYKTFSYSLIPFVLIFIGMAILNKKPELQLSTPSIYIAIGAYAVITGFIGVATSAWVNTFYGKHARQIKTLIDQLKED